VYPIIRTWGLVIGGSSTRPAKPRECPAAVGFDNFLKPQVGSTWEVDGDNESGRQDSVLRKVSGPLQKAADDALQGLAQVRWAMEATASYVLPRDAVDSPDALDE